MKSWIVTSISSLILFSSISYVGHFHTYWSDRDREYNRASIFKNSEACTNPRVRAHLGDFNLCDKSEMIMTKTPFIAALYDVAEDLNICGHNRCSILYVDVTKNLYKWIIGVVMFAFVGLWVGIIDLKQMWERSVEDYYRLPTKAKS